MLTASRSRGACQSCRSQLLVLFEQGFAAPLPCRLPRRPPASPASTPYFSRQFATSAKRWSVRKDVSEVTEHPGALGAMEGGNGKEGMEETVMKARQTFGETLPKDFLSEEEYKLYERLYGPPVRETMGRDLEFLGVGEEVEGDERVKNVLFRESSDGEFEEVEFDMEDVRKVSGEPRESTGNMGIENAVEIQAQNQREVDAILRLQKDMDTAKARPAQNEYVSEEAQEWEEVEEEELEVDEEPDAVFGGDHARTHPHTMIGRWGTSPSTLTLPEEQFIVPITELLSRTHNKHLSEAAERAFGGPGLPFSSSTPASKKHLPQKHIGLDPSQHKMSEIEADAYIAGVMPGVYAAVMSTLVEVRKRLGSKWIRDLILREGGEGPRVLDAGAGGAGLLAWQEVIQAELNILRDEKIVSGVDSPRGKSVVLTGPTALKDRMSRLLNDTTFIPRLPDYVHSSNSEKLLDGAPAQGRKTYDVIIAPHTLLPLKEDFRRKHQIQNLWALLDPNGGVLVLIEKGLPRGFEAVAGARALLLNSHIASPTFTYISTPLDSPKMAQFIEKEQGMIIAPCTNHVTCPMYKIEGLSSGRKDFCHFNQRFIRPPFLQQLLGAKLRNHEDVKFSYLAVRRGVDARIRSPSSPGIVQGDEATEAAFAGHETPFDAQDGLAAMAGASAVDPSFEALAVPRAILPPLKRRGHVTLDLCTPAGKVERWTVPKSFSAQAYRDARKSKHGDLWALGAKTRTVRNVRLGKPVGGAEEDGEEGLKGRMKRRKGEKKERMERVGKERRGKKNTYEVLVGEKGMEGIRELRGGEVDTGKRTKGGRVDREDRKTRELMRELEGEDEDDDYEVLSDLLRSKK